MTLDTFNYETIQNSDKFLGRKKYHLIFFVANFNDICITVADNAIVVSSLL